MEIRCSATTVSLLGDSLTMPDDWGGAGERDGHVPRSAQLPSPAMMWDIHDGLSWLEADVEGLERSPECDEFPVPIFFDAVDDCGIEDPFDLFSRVWQDC